MVERFLKSKIKELGEKFRLKGESVVSAKNRLTNSYIYGIDDGHVVSQRNKLVNSELPEMRDESSIK